ncbi:hypothetical protein SAMN05877753_10455 [Bacillus oleivorans]|uniref:Uncharacterized protein n=1 Tax=Bacillus oleivorans TaxID=1448271 RepID=A0A285CTQ2_9BACI|nr:hypothetical protein [Bacillus oleivorans]SNX70333.1 hypothetical protein SAMN05877753_10455 [Bacillus oleivorans]
MNLEERKKIFNEELTKLKDSRFIEDSVYEKIKMAYQHFYFRPTIEEEVPVKTELTRPNLEAEPKPAPVVKPPKPKKTAQEIRDRNVTWVLIIGVVLLLMGGLVLATSNWDVMTAMMKTALISGVSILFFFISWFSGHKLKIKQTAFAFLTLGSLFLPIVIFSAGYFELFGPWLSVFGDGKYVLGLLGAFICLPLYAFHAKRQGSRLFVWFSLITLSIGVGYSISAFNPPIDVFYLGIVIYNAILLLAYVRLKSQKQWELFTKEIPLFAQANLVFSTVLMLFFYENSIFHSFNLILTAIIFLAMIFVLNRKEYNFVFTLLFVYGVYQLIENSILVSVDVVLYALVGFVFLFLQNRTSQEGALRKIFQSTNAIISFCAFIFISYKGLALRWDEPSWLLVIAYFLISINYIVLSNVSKFRLFSILAPVFAIAGGLHTIGLIYNEPTIDVVSIHIFAVGVLLFLGGFYWNKWHYTKSIKLSSFFISFGPMLLSLLIAFVTGSWVLLTVLLVIYGSLMFVTYRSISLFWCRETAGWLVPISWLFAGLTLYPHFLEHVSFYQTVYGDAFHIGVVGILLLGISFGWNKLGISKLTRTTFWVAEGTYTWGILLSMSEMGDPYFVRAGLFLGAIPMYYLLAKRISRDIVWNLIPFVTLAAYLSLIQEVWESNHSIYPSLCVGGAILLIVLDAVLKKAALALRNGYFYLAHLYLPVSLLSVSIFMDNQPFLFVMAMGIYGYSIWKRTREWEKRLFLYLGFTTLLLFLVSYQVDMDVRPEWEPYTIWATSAIIFILWLVTNEVWKDRIKWYLVPISILGTFVLTTSYYLDYPLIVFGAAISLIVISLTVVHYSDWHLFAIIPLLLIDGALKLLDLTDGFMVLSYLGIAIILLLIGFVLFPNLYRWEKVNLLKVKVDWYAVASFLLILNAYAFINWDSPLWLKEIPPLFISLVLFLQIKRVEKKIVQNIVITVACISVLHPYYVWLGDIYINPFIETELYILPWVALVIFLEKRTWKTAKKQMDLLLWAVLIVVASLLIFDALESNTIYDAIIAGSLSLFALVAGLFFRRKSFFFIGSGMLLLNLLLQTRPYWGRLPWWAYLLIAGSVLIAVASFYEWQKQKKDNDGNTFLQVQKQKFVQKWNEWQ